MLHDLNNTYANSSVSKLNPDDIISLAHSNTTQGHLKTLLRKGNLCDSTINRILRTSNTQDAGELQSLIITHDLESLKNGKFQYKTQHN